MTASACSINWSTYQFGIGHGSYNAAATAVTKANASSLVQAWRWVPPGPTIPGQPGAQLISSPTVFNGRVYIGAKTGVFYALDEATGAVVWQRLIGYQTGITCTAQGFGSTATVAPDPVSGEPTVYLSAFNGVVVALKASDGTVKWEKAVVTPSSSANDYALWSSPTVANGHVYVGTSSACDKPHIRAGVVSLSQTTGTIEGNYYTQDLGHIGGSVWSSVAVDSRDGSVFVATGNPDSKIHPDDAESIVRLNGATMAKTAIWRIPEAERTFDADFGASPTLFTATIGGVKTNMVGACSKNGIYYALNRDNLAAGPVWQRRMGIANSDPRSCIGGSSFDGSRLYQGSNTTTIAGTSYPGSIRALDPATGTPIWEKGLPTNVINTPTLNGSGVLGVGTFDPATPTTNTAYLIDTSNGTILRTFNTLLNGGVFAQMVFADNNLFIPSVSNGLRAFQPPSTMRRGANPPR